MDYLLDGADGTPPLLQAASENLREAMKSQSELMQLFKNSSPGSATTQKEKKSQQENVRLVKAHDKRDDARQTFIAPPVSTLKNFEEPLHLAFEDHPYLVDHSIIHQPEGWPFWEDLNPVVPLAMTLELFAEAAQRQAPGKKILKISQVSAYKWLSLEQPIDTVISGIWKTENLLDLKIGDYAQATVTIGDEWETPLQKYTEEIDIGEPIMEVLSAEELYERYAFHGPQYHSSIKGLDICAKGMCNLAEKKAGKGSLLDILGQQLGLFLHLTQRKNVISFPVRLKELNFYTDFADQEGVFKHTLIITRMTDNAITGDMVLTRDGKIWAIAQGYVCQRFESDPALWRVAHQPQENLLSQEIAPGVFYYANTGRNNVFDFLVLRYLNYADKKVYAALPSPSTKRDYITSRIALKDAVRAFVKLDDEGYLFPVEIFQDYEENGRPVVSGYGSAETRVTGTHVSISHKNGHSVAMASKTPIGIDIERVEEKLDSFIKGAFTASERKLLESFDRPEGAIRFWVAKEACAKKAGVGLQGNPKQYEVTAVKGEVLTVGNDQVQTMRINEEYIVGWTI
jgi:phosphopantetheinyl transferase